MPTSSSDDIARHRGVIWLLRLEGLAVLAAATSAYAWTGTSWWLYAALFFTPDLAIAGYLGGPRIGAMAYNFAHTYALWLPVAAIGFATTNPLLLAIGLILVAHIGFDRALGYGLKYASGFKDTHLGRIGGPNLPT